MDSEVTSASRKQSSDLQETFLNKRDLKQLQKTQEPVQVDMSMIFTPLVKRPSSTHSTKSCSSNDENKEEKPQLSKF